jgi:putative ABC transport system ATP-binding protein
MPPHDPAPAQDLLLHGVTVTASGAPLILDCPELAITAGSLVGISGVSGSGKTTLIQVIAGIRAPTAGRVVWGDSDITALDGTARDAWRRGSVGLVFQEFQLIPELSALDNVLLPLSFAAARVPSADRTNAGRLLDDVGVAQHTVRVALMSRGEQQRIALARALLKRPALILADEPTASLDAANAAAVADLLVAAARASGATLVIVSHDPAVLARLDRSVQIVAGRVAG